MRVCLPAIIVLATVMPPTSRAPLTLVQTIELQGVEGRIDHLALDAAAGKLFVAALGNNTVEVVDVKNAVHLRSLRGFREPQGIAIATDAGVVAVANAQGEGLQLISANDYTPGKSVSLGDDADNVRYDGSAKRLYVGYGEGAIAGGEGFIDVLDARPEARLARIARLKTDAGARTALFAPDQHRLYLAVPHRGEQKAAIKVYEVG